MHAGNLTVGERIHAHLRTLSLDGLGDMDTWPLAATQEGIAHATGISRAHASLELKRLEGKGLVEVLRHRHVEDGTVRRVVYRALDPQYVVANGNGTPLPIVMGRLTTLRVAVFRCPSCGQRAKVALQE